MKIANIEPEIVSLASTGTAPKEIAQAVGASVTSVYKIMVRHGIDRPGVKPKLEGKEDEIRAMFRAGEYYASVARKYGVTKKQVILFCQKRRIFLTDKGKANAKRASSRRSSEETVAEVIERNSVSYKYISGYETSDSRVLVECTACGDRHRISYTTVRHRKDRMKCKRCAEKEIAEARLAKEQEKAKRQEERARLKAEMQMKAMAEKKPRPCCVCGDPTLRRKYCERCAKRIENQKKEASRRAKIRGAIVDRDISVQGLYKRDRGICYICGMATRWDDYIVKDGTTICGDWYPSIDHVTPLAKGGLHAWDNVRLAHRRCNYVKSDN